MAEVVLARVDSRLVHGQVVTKWVNQVMADRIVIVDNTLVSDEFMIQIYEMSAPPGMKLAVLNEDDVVAAWKADQLGTGKVLMLFPSIPVLKRVVDAGLELKNVQIGGLGGGPQRKVVYKNITLDQNDYADLTAMQDKGIDIIFQTIPEDSPVSLKSIKKM